MLRSKIDLYAQLSLMTLSLIPFGFLFESNVKSKDFIFMYLFHGLFLIVLGIWQITCSVLLYKKASDFDQKKYFKNNLFIALFYLGIFIIFLEVKSLRKFFDEGIVAFLLIADILVIRFWLYLKKYYQL